MYMNGAKIGIAAVTPVTTRTTPPVPRRVRTAWRVAVVGPAALLAAA